MSLANPPTPWSPTRLYDLAVAVLSVCEQALADAGLVVPGLAYLFGGASPVGACEQLVVGWAFVGHGTPSAVAQPAQVHGQNVPRRASLPVWCFRKLQSTISGEATNLTTFDSTLAQADAATIMGDAYVLHKGLTIARNAGMFNNAAGSPVVVDDFVPLASLGGLGGCRGGLIVELS